MIITVVTMVTLVSPLAKVKSVRDVLCVSGPDLQRLTGLSRSDIQQLILAAASACRRSRPIPGQINDQLIQAAVYAMCVMSRHVNPCFCLQPSCYTKESVSGSSPASDSVWAVLCWTSCLGGGCLWGGSLSCQERAAPGRLSWPCSSACLYSTPTTTEGWAQVSERTITTGRAGLRSVSTTGSSFRQVSSGS